MQDKVTIFPKIEDNSSSVSIIVVQHAYTKGEVQVLKQNTVGFVTEIYKSF